MITHWDIGKKFYFLREPEIEYQVLSVDRSVLFNVKVSFTNPYTGDESEEYFSEDIDVEKGFRWLEDKGMPPIPTEPKVDHTGHKIITNSAGGNVFRVCTKCKVEVFE